MTDFKTDEEKAEELKAWWKENGTSVMAGVGLAVAALFGWEYWKDHKVATAEGASALYTESRNTEKPEEANRILQQLREEYSSTPYAAMAGLQEAKTHAEAGEYQKAADSLQWVIDNSGEAEYQDVARLRLARVLVAMGKPDQALELTTPDYPEAYESLLEEIKGDIFAAQKKTEEARKAYERAILTNSGGSTEFIQMKLDDLG
ncbi:MAG: YfgM family protein [Thiolinea sp.]